jgi:predicted amidohydrolase
VYDAGGGWRVGVLVCEDLWHPALTYLLAAAARTW